MLKNSLLFTLSDNLVKAVYKCTLGLPYKYQSSLGDQLRRACLSIVLNIVEGGAQFTIKEKTRYLRISFASLKETKYLIYFAYDLKLLENNDFVNFKSEINHLARILYGLIRKNYQSIRNK